MTFENFERSIKGTQISKLPFEYLSQYMPTAYCTAERLFSVLKIMKNDLRSTML